MAIISLNIPDAQDNRVADAICSLHGWTSSSGLTKKQFVKKYLIDVIKDDVKAFEGRAVKDTHRSSGDVAEQQVITSVEAEVLIT